MTGGAATLEQIAATAPPQTEPTATGLLAAAAQLGRSPDTDLLESATEAVALLERGGGLHAELVDPGIARGAGDRDRDPPATALAGAWLIGRGAEEISACGDEAAARWAAAAREIVGARMLELEDLYDPARSAERRLRVAASRTGALLALSGRLGAGLAGADRAAVDAASEFGRELGVAIEIEDEAGGDRIAAGVYPTALAYALESDPEIASRLGTPLSDDAARAAVEAIDGAGGFERARGEADERIAAARRALDGLDAAALTALADEVAERR